MQINSVQKSVILKHALLYSPNVKAFDDNFLRMKEVLPKAAMEYLEKNWFDL